MSAPSAWWSPPPGVGTDCSISPVAYLPYVCEARFLEVARLKPGTFVKPGVLDMVGHVSGGLSVQSCEQQQGFVYTL